MNKTSLKKTAFTVAAGAALFAPAILGSISNSGSQFVSAATQTEATSTTGAETAQPSVKADSDTTTKADTTQAASADKTADTPDTTSAKTDTTSATATDTTDKAESATPVYSELNPAAADATTTDKAASVQTADTKADATPAATTTPAASDATTPAKGESDQATTSTPASTSAATTSTTTPTPATTATDKTEQPKTITVKYREIWLNPTRTTSIMDLTSDEYPTGSSTITVEPGANYKIETPDFGDDSFAYANSPTDAQNFLPLSGSYDDLANYSPITVLYYWSAELTPGVSEYGAVQTKADQASYLADQNDYDATLAGAGKVVDGINPGDPFTTKTLPELDVNTPLKLSDDQIVNSAANDALSMILPNGASQTKGTVYASLNVGTGIFGDSGYWHYTKAQAIAARDLAVNWLYDGGYISDADAAYYGTKVTVKAPAITPTTDTKKSATGKTSAKSNQTSDSEAPTATKSGSTKESDTTGSTADGTGAVTTKLKSGTDTKGTKSASGTDSSAKTVDATVSETQAITAPAATKAATKTAGNAMPTTGDEVNGSLAVAGMGLLAAIGALFGFKRRRI